MEAKPPQVSDRAPEGGAAAKAEDGTRPQPRTLAPEERRRSPRVELRARVGFETSTNFYVGFSENISEGGLFVATSALQDIGTPVTVELSLPSGETITAAGIVCWRHAPSESDTAAVRGMGIQFRDLAARDLTAIRKFISWREPVIHES